MDKKQVAQMHKMLIYLNALVIGGVFSKKIIYGNGHFKV
jgi:hypothetical protein